MAEMTDVLEWEQDCDTFRDPSSVKELNAMSDLNDDPPTPAPDFAEAAEPSLRTVLMHQAALIDSGDLKTISRAEWDRGVDETERIFKESRHLNRKI